MGMFRFHNEMYDPSRPGYTPSPMMLANQEGPLTAWQQLWNSLPTGQNADQWAADLLHTWVSPPLSMDDYNEQQ